MTRRLVLALILVVYFIVGALFAVKTPAWQAPDEPAHYNYVAYVANNGSFPVLHPGDYPHAYLEQVKAAKFPPGMPLTSIRYEFHQPPLYYVLAVPVYVLTGDSLVVLRLLSVVLGAGIVVFAYATARRAVPAHGAIALGAAAIVAFLPQHLATVSQVGNDVLAELLLAAVLYVSVRILSAPLPEPAFSATPASSVPAPLPKSGFSQKPGLSVPWRTYLLLGLLLGLVLITKTTAYVAVPLALGAVAWRWLQDKPPFRQIALDALAVVLPAALIALPWYARDIYVYGWPDFLGLIRHEQIVVGQMRTADYIAQNGWPAYWQRAVQWTFKSFVGVFGWMGVWLDSRVYYLMGLWLAIPLLAWLIGATAGTLSGAPSPTKARRRRMPGHGGQHAIYVFLGAAILLTFLTYLYYNITFLQHQGRYLFTALIPIAVFLAIGWRSVFEPLVGRILAIVLAAWSALLAVWGAFTSHGLPKWPIAITAIFAVAILAAGFLPDRVRRWAYALPFALLPVVALYALFGAIVPALALP
jgi:4-amino-4-deoxy-L-arabinose transferase-like glycosyltransferase